MDSIGKEKLVAADNLMPKAGEGSIRGNRVPKPETTNLCQVKYTDLNPIWNEKLVFHINSAADLPYRTIEANVFN